MVISVALMSVILVAAYACLHAGLSTQKLIEPRTDIFQSARVALALISADLRCACPLPKDAEFLGAHRMAGEIESDNMDFATHHYTPHRSNEGDFCEVSIFLEKDPKTGQQTLWRRRNPVLAFDSLSGGNREEIATGLLGLKLEFFDGFEWYESWGETGRRTKAQSSSKDHPNLTGMPEAVRMTLLFDSNPRRKLADPGMASRNTEPPLVFQTVVQLSLADTAPANSAQSPSGNSDPTGGQPNGGPVTF
jgi:hypothetical protein